MRIGEDGNRIKDSLLTVSAVPIYDQNSQSDLSPSNPNGSWMLDQV